MPKSEPVDLSDLSLRETRLKMGELVEMALRAARVAVLIQRRDGVVTLLGPEVLAHPTPELVEGLLRAWEDDDHITEFLNHLESYKERIDG